MHNNDDINVVSRKARNLKLTDLVKKKNKNEEEKIRKKITIGNKERTFLKSGKAYTGFFSLVSRTVS